VVQVRHDASRRATVLEVRVDDRPGVVYLACRAVAELGISVRSAHVATLGPQAVDVFYLAEPGAGALADDRAAAAAHAVRRALGVAATLDP
jgi:[protein-PII] uridylyltransferase